MALLEIELLPVLTDNYVYLLHDPRAGASGVVDPAVAEPVLERLRARPGPGLDPGDAPPRRPHRRPRRGQGGHGRARRRAARRRVADSGPRRAGRRGRRGGLRFARGPVVETPGHTSGHVSYWFPQAEALFCGDTMFALGCGRLFEGDAPTMWRSLGKLAALPDATRVYCGHEYTQSNARFALTVDPDNEALRRRAAEVDAARAQGRPTIPTTIGREKATSPSSAPATR